MNKPRRKHIDQIIEQLEGLQEEIEEIFDEEDDYKENMPENLWDSEKYDRAEEACDYLSDASDAIAESVSHLEYAKA